MNKKILRKVCRYNNSLIDRQLSSIDYGAVFSFLKKQFAIKKPQTILLFDALPHEVSLEHIEKRIDARYDHAITYIVATKDLDDDLGSIDYAFVPGLAFDATGARLGQGGGWYDAFFANHPETYKIGICYKEQLLEVGKIPLDEWDVAMNSVVTL